MTKKKTTNKKTNHNTSTDKRGQNREVPATLIEHVMELKSRLFWVAMFFVVSAAAVYPFFTQIVSVLTAPLGGEELHYFSPAGGLSFIIKICMYLGIVGALPAFIYHFYKFIQPAMPEQRARTLIGYTIASAFLAICGVLFTYNFILPAAVNFLTSFEIAGVDPMLSVDAYMSFVIAYIVAGAFLFQLPLVMLIINSITPLKPSTLLSYERHVIIGAFVTGAVLSPTPDVVNQSLLALPLIVMYQIGFVLVVVKNRFKRREKQVRRFEEADLYEPLSVETPAVAMTVTGATPTASVARSEQREDKSAAAKLPQPAVAISVSPSEPTQASSPRFSKEEQPPQEQPIQRQPKHRGSSIDGTLRQVRPVASSSMRRPSAGIPTRAVLSERCHIAPQSIRRGRSIDGVIRTPRLVQN